MNTEVYERFVEALQADFDAYVDEAYEVADENPELSLDEVTDKISAPREIASAEEREKYAVEYEAALLYVVLSTMTDAMLGTDTDVSVYLVEV